MNVIKVPGGTDNLTFVGSLLPAHHRNIISICEFHEPVLEGIRNIGRIWWIEVFRLIKRKILFQVPELIDFVLLDSKQIKKSWRLSGWGIDSVLHRKRLVDVCQICKGSSECRKREMQRPSEGVFDVKFGKFPHLHICTGKAIRAARALAPPLRHPTLFYAALTICFIFIFILLYWIPP